MTLGPGAEWASAYRLVPAEAYEGEGWASLAEKLSSVDDARLDPSGFYHGVRVRRAGRAYVLSGPPARFVPGEEQQLGLFEDA